jgi:hypothetical protein
MKLECYRLFGMSLKLFSSQEPECKCLYGFRPSSLQHIVAHVRSMYQSVVMPFAKHLPERKKEVEKVEEGII